MSINCNRLVWLTNQQYVVETELVLNPLWVIYLTFNSDYVSLATISLIDLFLTCWVTRDYHRTYTSCVQLQLSVLCFVHIERVTLCLRLRVTRRRRRKRKVPHSIGYQTHFINVCSNGLTKIMINFVTKFPT